MPQARTIICGRHVVVPPFFWPHATVLLFSPPRRRFCRSGHDPVQPRHPPILSDNCFQCHGPGEKDRKGGLRLDLAEAAMKPAESGAVAIVPGNARQSELVARILTDHADDQMPPPKSQKTLTHEQKELLRRWIDEGAEYQGHWAFIPPQRPDVPDPGIQTPWFKSHRRLHRCRTQRQRCQGEL